MKLPPPCPAQDVKPRHARDQDVADAVVVEIGHHREARVALRRSAHRGSRHRVRLLGEVSLVVQVDDHGKLAVLDADEIGIAVAIEIALAHHAEAGHVEPHLGGDVGERHLAVVAIGARVPPE